MNVTPLNKIEVKPTTFNFTKTYSQYDDRFISKKSTNNEKMEFEHKLIKEKTYLKNDYDFHDDYEDIDVPLDEKALYDVENLLYNNNLVNTNKNMNGINTSNLFNKMDNVLEKNGNKMKINNLPNSHSLPQLPIYSYNKSFKNCAAILNNNYNDNDNDDQENKENKENVENYEYKTINKINSISSSIKKKEIKEGKLNFYF
jgi:hypothetical protein